MTGRSILVTGAGGPAGISVIRHLVDNGHRVVGADCDPLAAGLQLAHAGIVLPPWSDPAYVDALIEGAVRQDIGCLVSTLAEEMVALGRRSDRLGQRGIRHWLPSETAVQTCVDKWEFAAFLEREELPGPATGLAGAAGVPGPWIVKPRFGRGSRHVIAVDDPADMAWALREVPEPIVQTRVPGREFTVDVLVDRDGSLAGAVPRWRLETKAGISTKGETFESERLHVQVQRLMRALRFEGPANVQGFIDERDVIRFVEVNPRFSGGLPLSLAAGADLVGQYLAGIHGHPLQRERLGFRPGVVMIRHFTEIFTTARVPAAPAVPAKALAR